MFPPTSEVARLKGGAVYAEYNNVSLAARLTVAFITYDESRKVDIIILCIHRATFQARHLSVFTRRWEHQRNTDLAKASSQQLKSNTGYDRAFVDKIDYNKHVSPYFWPQMRLIFAFMF